MKKLHFIFIMSVLVWGCDKSEQYAVTARIDGVEWISKGAVPAILTANGLLINASNPTQSPIAISIDDLVYNVIGSHPIDSTNNAFLYGSSITTGYFAKPSNPGALNITEVDASEKRVKGTFELMTYSLAGDSVHVTDGTFNIVYQN
ncbi:MAG: hypothetical protein IAE67_10345 [Candidatus Competibacteraceae bacterium]|nr:hypothetical protein [Candidatus Competibacteraceae bacterium]